MLLLLLLLLLLLAAAFAAALAAAAISPGLPAVCCATLRTLQGAIIIVGVMGLLDYPEFIYLWKTNKFDWLVWNVAFLFTIFLVSACLGVCGAAALAVSNGGGWCVGWLLWRPPLRHLPGEGLLEAVLVPGPKGRIWCVVGGCCRASKWPCCAPLPG